MNENNKKIIDFMTDKEIVSHTEIVMRFGSGYEIPPYETLAGRYMVSKISQALSRARDKEGYRRFLSKRGESGTQVVNIANCKDASPLEEIKKRIRKDIAGQGASLKRVKLQIEKIRQLGFSDFPPDGGGDAA